MQPKNIGLTIDKILIESKNVLIQIGKLKFISNKRKREIDKDKEKNMACK